MPTPQLEYYKDGTPSVLKKAVVIQELNFYKRSDILYQLTTRFCERFLPPHGDRTVDQMVQAARSTKQNIVEGSSDGQTSSEVELKLLGIAKGSNKELLEDYTDYLKRKNLKEWFGHSTRFDKLHKFCATHLSFDDYLPYFDRWTDEEMANCAICLCHMLDKALATYISNKDKQFVTEGGIRERMTAARLGQRATQTQIIKELQEENRKLKEEIRQLKALIAENAG